jgi:branched-subunit amino acid aminotransferase/4-amino-4-deoxychorismate lyase
VSTPERLEVDGREVSAEAAVSLASGFGHFTAMQVRGGRTRGLSLHFARLVGANRELFGAELDVDHVRDLIGHALGDTTDASVRVYVFETESEPAIMVTVRPPGGVRSPQRLLSVRYQRPDAHLKHLATEQGYYTRVAQRAGFDDALLADDGGTVSESATANIGFFDGTDLVWPDAPMLHGITMQLLEGTLPERGVPTRRAAIRLGDIASIEGAFLSYARGIAVVSGVDDVGLPANVAWMKTLSDAYDAVPWDPI